MPNLVVDMDVIHPESLVALEVDFDSFVAVDLRIFLNDHCFAKAYLNDVVSLETEPHRNDQIQQIQVFVRFLSDK